jgi:hypothetical protein
MELIVRVDVEGNLYMLVEELPLHEGKTNRHCGQRVVTTGASLLSCFTGVSAPAHKRADWIVDLGPEGGDEGGEVIATGTPEDVAEVEESSTGQFLRNVLAERAAAAA